jgi:hypothetical protein
MQLCNQLLDPHLLVGAGDSLAICVCLNLIIGITPEIINSLKLAFYHARNKFLAGKCWCKPSKKAKVKTRAIEKTYKEDQERIPKKSKSKQPNFLLQKTFKEEVALSETVSDFN